MKQIVLGKNVHTLHCVAFEQPLDLEELEELFFDPEMEVWAFPSDGKLYDVRIVYTVEELLKLHGRIGLQSAHALHRDSLFLEQGTY